MKKNGFTLVELIAVVTIIAIVLLVAIPQITSTMANTTVKEQDAFKQDIEQAAASYVENDWINFKTNVLKGNTHCIAVSTLVDNGYLKNTTIDPSTNSPIDVTNKYVYMYNISGNYGKYRFKYEYVDAATANPSRCPLP